MGNTVLEELCRAHSEPGIATFTAVIGACGKGEQWQRALGVLRQAQDRPLEPTAMS